MWTIADMTPTPDSPPSPRLLVVTIDRLPAWMLSAWGATWVAMPAIDALAARGLVFDRLITPSTDPAATIRDLVGGLVTLPVGAAGPDLGAGPHPPLTVVTDDPSVVAGLGIDPDVEVRHVAIRASERVEQDESRTNLARLFAAAVEVVGATDRRIVWCHAGSLGVAWDAPETFRDAYIDPEDPAPPFGARPPEFRVDAETDPDLVVGVRQVYAGQLTLLDRQLGLLIDAIGRATGADGWTVLVAGVRGLSLGLHGWVGCGGDAVPFGETVHVPAVLVDASGRSCGQRYGGLVVPADLGVTLRELAAGDRSAGPPAGSGDAVEPGRGRSLVPLLETWSLPPRDRIVVNGREGKAIVTPAWHLLMEDDAAATEPRVRLFAKPDDYFELSDVADRCPAVVDALR
jgi:arylsulfatase A-like enzyme